MNCFLREGRVPTHVVWCFHVNEVSFNARTPSDKLALGEAGGRGLRLSGNTLS